MTRISIIALLIFLLFSCSNYDKKYYGNGKLKSIVRTKGGNKVGREIIFNINGDTLEINHYSRGIMDGTSIQYSYDSSNITKKIFNYDKGILSGSAYEFKNGNLRFEWNYLDNLREGSYKAYYPNGNLKFLGHFSNDLLCILNEYDRKGNILSIHRTVDYEVESKGNNEYLLDVDLCKTDDYFDTLDILYAFYKIEGADTIKITENLYDILSTTNSRFTVPINRKDTGLFCVQLAVPTITNYDRNHLIYILPFRINGTSAKAIKSDDNNRLKIKW